MTKFNAAAWIAADPSAPPSAGQIFALLMPSKGGLSTGRLRATEAAARLEGLGLRCWTRRGIANINDAIRSSAERRAAGQRWLDGLLAEPAPAAAPKAAEPAPAPKADPKVEQAKAADGKVWVTGHWRRARPARGE